MGDMITKGLGISNNYSASPYASALSPQEGIDQYLEDLNRKADIYHGQQSLAQALQAQMNGTGPNPAQTQYLANVNNNIANAQGLIASQRGLNPALAARMGSNAAAHANQQASLGSALLQQQQQLGATNSLGNLYGQMQGGNLSYLGLQDSLNQSANKLNADVAAQNAATAGKVVGGLLNSGVGGMGSNLSGGGGGSSSYGAGMAPSSGGSGAMAGGAGDAGGMSAMAPGAMMVAARGGVVSGRAKVRGNSYANDTVPILASPGEGIIDREHMTSRKSAHAKVDEMFDKADGHDDRRKDFLDHLVKGKSKSKSQAEYGDVITARRKRK